ncbi:MAG: hypothetical protein CM15mP120_12480 [Pseudomonadota bacterium]|nr:MAG: hypothetical protein CM15mP120_12480 [Pseudomonadota bacterium]
MTRSQSDIARGLAGKFKFVLAQFWGFCPFMGITKSFKTPFATGFGDNLCP